MLIVSGLLLVTAALGVFGAVRLARDTDAVRQSASTMLEVPAVRDRVADELAREIEAVYAPRPVPSETATLAASRMLDNGAFVDEFERALGEMHEGWLDGDAPLVVMDAQVLTAAAISGMRDADLELANAFPTPRLVEVAPVELPVTLTADDLGTASVLAWAALIVGGLLAGFGLRLDPHLPRALARLSGVLGIAAVVVALTAAAAAVPATAGLSMPVALGVATAVISTKTVPGLALAGILLVSSLLARAASIRVGPVVVRRARRKAAKADTTPVKEGASPTGRNAGRHRAEALDAFFSEDEHQGTTPTGPDDDELVAMGFSLRPEETEDRTDATHGDDVDADGDAELTPEQRRAVAAADDRRAALERIDGTKGRLRTHLRR